MDHNLRDILMPLAIFGGLGGAITLFSKVMTDYILKKKMIEKGYVNEDTQSIFKQHAADDRFTALKWGLIIFFGGLSLILMEYIPSSPASPLPYGLFALSLSLGFLTYYFLVSRTKPG